MKKLVYHLGGKTWSGDHQWFLKIMFKLNDLLGGPVEFLLGTGETFTATGTWVFSGKESGTHAAFRDWFLYEKNKKSKAK